MWLLIDDERGALGCDVVARTPLGARKLLGFLKWEGACFDHDLGHGESGYDILTWALESGCLPPQIQLVTSNPSGRDRMALALKNAGYTTINGRDFKRAK